MKKLKLAVLCSLAAAINAMATVGGVVDYTPLSINLVSTYVNNNVPHAVSINNGNLLARINLYLGIAGTKLAVNNVNGHFVVLNAAGAVVADLSSGVYYTNPKDGVEYYVGIDGNLGISHTEFTSGSVALPNFSVGGTSRMQSMYIYFENHFPGYWETDYKVDINGGNVGNFTTSLKAGAYKQSITCTIYGGDSYDYILGNYGIVTGTISATGTSAVAAPSFWDPFTTITL